MTARGLRSKATSMLMATCVIAGPMAAATPARAQEGTVVGTVRSVHGDTPVNAAEVILVGTGLETLTDESGDFRIDSVPPGRHEVEIRHLGYASRAIDILVRPATTVDLDARVEYRVVPVSELEVTVRRKRVRGKLAGFYKRRRKGFGHFLEREDIEKVPGHDLHRVFREIPGVTTSRCPGQMPPPGCYLVGSGRSTGFSRRGCLPTVVVDGAEFRVTTSSGEVIGSGINAIPKTDVEAVEVYTGPAGVPARYRSLGSSCGMILLWTR